MSGIILQPRSVVPSMGEGQYEASRVHQTDCWWRNGVAAGGTRAAANRQGLARWLSKSRVGHRRHPAIS
jgi:hypothetical protein